MENDERNIEVIRGTFLPLTITALNKDGTDYIFQNGDVVRFKVFERKNVEKVWLSKDFIVEEENTQMEIDLTSEDMKIGDLINRPTEYWYEIELNPDTPYTNAIIGYDKEKGPAILWLLPEGGDRNGTN